MSAAPDGAGSGRGVGPRFARLVLPALVVGGAAFAGAADALDRAPPAQALETKPFVLGRADEDPLTVSRDAPVLMPYVFGDAELTCTVELPPRTDLDLVVRSVTPRRLADGDMPLFHGRFVVLRIRAVDPGEGDASGATGAGGGIGPLLSRTEALFDRSDAAGIPVTPGRPATVWLRMQGRRVVANVAGLGPYEIEASDAHGSVGFLLHERDRVLPDAAPEDPALPRAVVRDLRIDLLPRPGPLPWRWIAGGVGASLGVLLGVLLGWSTAPVSGLVWRSALAAAALGLGAACAGRFAFPLMLEGAAPGAAATGLVALTGLPFALLALLPLRALLLFALPAALASTACVEAALQVERTRLQGSEDPRLDAWFGLDSGTAPLDALAGRTATRRGNFGPRGPAGSERVVFLGGRPVFEAAGDRAYDLGAFSAHLASQQAGILLEAFPLTTVFGNCVQQLRLFRSFYADPPPALVVCAIPPTDAEAIDVTRPAWSVGREPGQAPELVPVAGSLILGAWRAAARPPVPPVAAQGVQRMLDELSDLATASGSAVLLVDDPSLPSSFRAALREAAASPTDRIWRVEIPLSSLPPREAAERLASAIGARIR